MTEQAAPSAADELELLKERARTLGITFPNNIRLDTLRQRVQAKLDGSAETEADVTEDEAPAPAARRKTKIEIEQDTRDRMQRDCMKLVRCRVHCLNPMKNDLTGELFAVANKYLGTVSRFIPYGIDWHIEQVLFDDLKGRQYQHVGSREKNGKIEITARLVPEYNVEVLEALSTEELQELALKQAAAERVGV